MKSRVQYRSGSFDWNIVREALRRALPSGKKQPGSNGRLMQNREVEITVLINDIFGGKILRTHNNRGWHLYNRINGERVDLAGQVENTTSVDSVCEKSSDAGVETSGYFEQNDYSTFFLRFVTAFEEAAGFGRYQTA
ncbi:MAG: hypothetical protein WAV93_02985 [Bacteroidales bacterium]